MSMCLKRQVGGKRQEVREWIRKVFVEGGISNILVLPFIQTYSILLSTTSQRLAVRPFSPERETFEPLPLSIQIHSVRLHCLFSPRYLYLHQKMYIYYFMLYLAESLTGRSYTEGQLAKRFPLWRERVESRIHYVNQKEWQE